MHVRWLEVAGFRNYLSLSFAPDPGLNALLGPNGHGKTSLLEALHVLLTGRSFRTPRLADCLGWDAGGRTRLAGEVVEGVQGRTVRLAFVARGSTVDVQGELCPWARAVSFQAADLGLLTGEPRGRRAYLDGVVTRLIPAHAATCRRYRLVLLQRSRLLGDLASRPDAGRLLEPWDEQLAALGSEIVHRRLEVLGVLAVEAREIREALMPDGGALELRYEASVEPETSVAGTQARLRAALAAGRVRDLGRGLTLVGPHRDDLGVRVGRTDARIAASRGEQRLLTLTLRLAEAGVVRRRLGTAPVFLLDDLLSELDQLARARVLAWLRRQGQVLFSGPDGGAAVETAAVWQVKDADVSALDQSLVRGVA